MRFLNHIVEMIKYFPGKFGDKLRIVIYKKIMKGVGYGVEIKDGTTILCPERIKIGDFSGINQMCYLNAYGGIEIGDDVRIAPNVAIISTDHKFDDIMNPIGDQGENPKKVIIEDDVWIGYGAVILKGVRIRRGSVIGANSLIRKDVEPFSIVVGNQKIIGSRL